MDLKERLFHKFGGVGLILYHISTILFSVLPVVMIGIDSIFFYLAVFTLLVFFPFPTEPIVWIWGLISTIRGEQDFFAILFYVLFAIYAIGYVYKFVSNYKKLG